MDDSIDDLAAGERQRLFIAIGASEAWRAIAGQCRDQLTAALPEAVSAQLRWVDPERLHLTLRFLGDTTRDQARLLRGELAAALRVIDVELTLAAAGTFGAPLRTSTIWLGIDGDRPGLDRLVAEVERAVVAAGVAREPRPFRPHLTLARVRAGASSAQRAGIAAAVRRLPAPPPGPLRVRLISLMRSHPGRSAPRYEVIERFGPDA